MARRIDPAASRIADALSRMSHGASKALAEACGIRPQNLTRWKRTGRIPAWHCRTVEEHTGLSRHELRPDVFGRAADAKQHRDQPAVEAVQRLEGEGVVHAGHRLASHGESMGTPRHGVSP
jgi:DNA-binding transcriptional regulator YdaS (Cro superfamily)